MTHRPLVAYTFRDRMPCAFYTLVIMNAALAKKFNGGLDGFIKKYSAECNHDIVVDCSMSGDDTMEILDDIVKCSLKPSEDFAIFVSVTRGAHCKAFGAFSLTGLNPANRGSAQNP